MSLTLLQAAAAEPLSVADCRLQCRIDDSVLDSLITVYIAAARAQAEFKTRRRLITQQWRQTIDRFPTDADIRLEVPPVVSVEAVTYRDTAGTTQTLSSSLYVLDAAVLPGYLLPAYGTTWPSTLDSPNAVSIDLTAGYGPAGVPRAGGGIVNEPVTLVGEAGPEAVVPLNNPGRAAAVMQKAGLGGGGGVAARV